MQIIKVVTVLLISFTIFGCASQSGSVYSRDQARQVQQVETGKILSIREVRIEGTKSPIGAVGGAAIGGIAGSSVGGGRGQAIASIVGAIAGGIAGAAVEETATRQNALELTVQLTSGRTISVVQTEENIMFQPGEPVKVLTSPSATRVVKW